MGIASVQRQSRRVSITTFDARMALRCEDFDARMARMARKNPAELTSRRAQP